MGIDPDVKVVLDSLTTKIEALDSRISALELPATDPSTPSIPDQPITKVDGKY